MLVLGADCTLMKRLDLSRDTVPLKIADNAAPNTNFSLKVQAEQLKDC